MEVLEQVHYFLVDLNDSGDYFKVGIKGDVDAAEAYLMGYSSDVRYVSSRESENETKGKKIDGGLIVSVRWYADKSNTFDTRTTLASPDRRHSLGPNPDYYTPS